MSDEIVEIGSVETGLDENVFECEHLGKRFVFELHPEVAKPNAYSFFLLDHVQIRRGGSVLDIGTGIGFLAIVIAGTYEVGRVIATDINPFATEISYRNAVLNDLQHKLDIRQGSFFEPIEGERFDLILSQPRQTPTPARIAETERRSKPYFFLNTSGGVDGLEFIGPVIVNACKHLNGGGRLQLVVVDYLGTNKLLDMMSSYGLVPEVSASLTTRLSPMTTARREYIEEHLQYSFPRDAEGREYMHLLVLTGTKV